MRVPPLTLALPVSAALLTGCVTAVRTTDGRELAMRSPEFQDYVEQVFRQQNSVATELLYAQEDAEGERYVALAELEDALLRACVGLNELAAARRDERRLSLTRRARLARGSPDCEVAALRVEAALQDLQR